MLPLKNSTLCPNCRMGVWQPKLMTYAAWHTTTLGDGSVQDIFIVTPAVPGWLCPTCGLRVFDQTALDHLSLLAGPPTLHAEGKRITGAAPQFEAWHWNESMLRRAQ